MSDSIILTIANYAAFIDVTKGMSEIEIYRQRGDGIRTPVQRKISKTVPIYLPLCKDPEYLDMLHRQGILFENMKIKANTITVAGSKLYQYSKKNNITKLSTDGISPEKFFSLKKDVPFDAPGIYVLYNKDKDKYYVGQTKRLSFRINQHFTGHGNGDVYADYKYGDTFLIFWKLLKSSGFANLNDMERYYIEKFGACRTGYNRTAGNN